MMKLTHLSAFLVLALVLVFGSAGLQTLSAQQQPAPKGVSFSQVSPVLQSRCGMCHSGAKAPRGLRLDTYDNTMKGSDQMKVIVPGEPQKSELMLRITGAKSPRMPRGGPPWLSQQETALVEEWIATGAKL